MANDNNKINNLVKSGDDDPTSELESLADKQRNDPGNHDELE